MASYLDYLISSHPGQQYANANIRPNAAPSTGGWASFGRVAAQKKENEKNRELEKSRMEQAKRRLQLDIDRLKLDQGKFDFSRQKSFMDVINSEEVQKALASGDPDAIERAQLMIRSAGGSVQEEPSESPINSIGKPAARVEPQAQPAQSPADQMVSDAKGQLSGLEHLESLSSLAGEEPSQGNVVTLDEPIVIEGSGATFSPGPAPDYLPAGLDQTEREVEGTQDLRFMPGESDETLGTTHTRIPKVPKTPGTGKPPTWKSMPIGKPGAPISQAPPDGPIVGTARTEDGEELPLRMEQEPVDPTTKRKVLDPFGNVVGTINVGGSDAVVEQAMKSISPYVQAWAVEFPGAPVEQLEAMARERVRSHMSAYNGSIQDGIDSAREDINKFFTSMTSSRNAETMSQQDMLGKANYAPNMDRGHRLMARIAKERGWEELRGNDARISNSINSLQKMLENPEEMDTIKFYQIVYSIARLNDGGGRLSDQDFERAMGESSLSERLQSFISGKVGLTWDDFAGELGVDDVTGAAKLPPIRLKRFLHYLKNESVRLAQKKAEAAAEAQAQMQYHQQSGALGIANGIGAYSNSVFGTSFEPINPLQALQYHTQIQQAAQVQQGANQGHQQAAQQVQQRQAQEQIQNLSPEEQQELQMLIGGGQ